MARSVMQRRMVWKPTCTAKSSATVDVADQKPLDAREKTRSDASEDMKSLGDGGSTRADDSDSERSELSSTERRDEAYSRNLLLRMRCHTLSLTDVAPADRLHAAPVPEELRTVQPSAPRPASPGRQLSISVASPPPSPSLTLSATPNSWAATRRRRQQEPDGELVTVERAVRSILNKLTLEKFEELYQKLLAISGLAEQVDVLAKEIFKKATLQHNFTAMYADLCARLDGDLSFNSDGTATGSMAFRSAILTQCRELFETSWQPVAAGETSEDTDQAEEAEALRKKAALGNLRFIGEMLVRWLLPPSELFIIAEDLRQAPVVPEKLEALATLLTVAGPVLDFEAWEWHDQLKVIFWDIRGLTFNPEIPTRVRCLLRDLLDLRDAGWVDTKIATRDQGPKGLKQLRNEAEAESSRSPKLRPRAEAATAMYGLDADSAEGAWPASEGMNSTYNEAWGCGTYMMFVPLEMINASWEATDTSAEMISAYA